MESQKLAIQSQQVLPLRQKVTVKMEPPKPKGNRVNKNMEKERTAARILFGDNTPRTISEGIGGMTKIAVKKATKKSVTKPKPRPAPKKSQIKK